MRVSDVWSWGSDLKLFWNFARTFLSNTITFVDSLDFETSLPNASKPIHRGKLSKTSGGTNTATSDPDHTPARPSYSVGVQPLLLASNMNAITRSTPPNPSCHE